MDYQPARKKTSHAKAQKTKHGRKYERRTSVKFSGRVTQKKAERIVKTVTVRKVAEHGKRSTEFVSAGVLYSRDGKRHKINIVRDVAPNKPKGLPPLPDDSGQPLINESEE